MSEVGSPVGHIAVRARVIFVKESHRCRRLDRHTHPRAHRRRG